MRVKSTLYNSVAGLINRIAAMVSVFLVRRFFVMNLETEYLGLEGLFSNILGIFSLVEFGLGTAISFDLFEPVHKKDRSQLSSFMMLYKKAYYILGAVIFALSLCFVPLMLNFIKDYTIDGGNIKLYFIIYASGVSVTYFFSYKRTLLFALQKNYIVLMVDSAIKILLSILQIYVLINYHNYLLYLVLIVLANISANIVVSIICDRGHYYDRKCAEPLSEYYKQKIIADVKAIAVTNISWQGIVSTDNIIISLLTGVMNLAKNANYTLMTAAISSIISSVLGGVSASVGDLLAEKDRKKIREYFHRYCFIYFICSSYAALGLFFVSADVITLWVGRDFVFDTCIVFVISFNLFLSLVLKPLGDYQNYSGCFVYYKSYSVVTLLINLSVSVIFAKIWGVIGVFLGSLAAYIFMIIVFANIIYKHIFAEKITGFFCSVFQFVLPMVVSFILLYFMFSEIIINNTAASVIFRIVMVTFVYFISVILILHRDCNYRYFKEFVLLIIKKHFCR